MTLSRSGPLNLLEPPPLGRQWRLAQYGARHVTIAEIDLNHKNYSRNSNPKNAAARAVKKCKWNAWLPTEATSPLEAWQVDKDKGKNGWYWNNGNKSTWVMAVKKSDHVARRRA